MEYSELKRTVLELIDQYSAAGDPVPLSCNGQSDRVHRIPGLLNQALMDIRTGIRPERAVCRLAAEQNSGTGWTAHSLPADFWRFHSGGVREFKDGEPVPTDRFRLLGRNQILTPPGEFLVEYDRYPEQLPADPPDTCPIDEDPEILQAACLYAAAGLVMTEDEFAYAALCNAYETRLSRLIPAPMAEVRPIQDAYGF